MVCYKQMLCKWCNGCDHVTCWDPLCRLYIAVEQRPRSSTIIGSLRSRIRDPRFLEVLRDAIKENNELFYRITLFSLHYVTHMVCNRIQLPGIDEGFYRKCMAVVGASGGSCSKNIPDSKMVDLYSSLGMDKVKHSGLMNINTYCIGSMVTLYENYNNFATESHIASYLRSKYSIQKGHAGWLGSVIYKDTNFKTIPKTIEGGVEFWKFVARMERNIYESYMNTNKYIEYRYYMLQYITDKSRSFTLLPVRTNGVKFITLDNRGMQFLEVKGRKLYPHLDPTYIKNLFSSLDSFFIRKPRNNMALSPTLKTNGYEIHTVYETTNTPRTTTGKLKQLKGPLRTNTDDWDPLYNINTKPPLNKIVGIDPGHHNLFTTSQGCKIGKGMYCHETYRKKHTMLTKKMLSGITMVTDTLKTTDMITLSLSIRNHVRMYVPMYNKMNHKKYLGSQFTSKIRQHKFHDDLLNLMSNNMENVLAFGDAKNHNGLRGTSMGGPVLKIIRHARKRGYKTMLVDEFRTTCMSYCCGERNKKMKDASGRDIHGLCICQKCHKVWSRDLGASKNIQLLAHRVLWDLPRPDYMTRNFEITYVA
jgi:hypothetical protein